MRAEPPVVDRGEPTRRVGLAGQVLAHRPAEVAAQRFDGAQGGAHNDERRRVVMAFRYGRGVQVRRLLDEPIIAAGHADTIRAINEAGLSHYVAKPWEPDDLLGVARGELTGYVIDHGLDPLAYLQVLDAPRLLEAYSQSARPD